MKLKNLRNLIKVYSGKDIDEKDICLSDLKMLIGDIDIRISRQLNEIFHHEGFQRLESAWQGLVFFLTSMTATNNIKIRVLNIKKEELLLDFEKKVEFDQSALFQKVYEEEFGTFGGEPYTIIIGDFEFTQSKKDLNLLENISNVASAAHTMFIAAPSPRLFDMDSFTEFAKFRNLNRIFKNPELLKWHSIRKNIDSRYICLVLPKILLRLPYGRSKGSVYPGNIYFEEEVHGALPDKYLWGSAAYALGQRICESFIEYGWSAKFQGVDGAGSGIVTGLPLPQFEAIDIKKMSTDILIIDSMEKELSQFGFTCLCHRKLSERPVFYNTITIRKPIRHLLNVDASINERLSTMLPHILIASRFAHYIKILMRTKIGKFTYKEQIEEYLNNWLGQYILGLPDESAESKAETPLAGGNVKIIEVANQPDKFKAIINIKPHYQLESLVASLKMVTEISQAKAG